jgi:DNA-binding transcriptional regulator YiaG
VPEEWHGAKLVAATLAIKPEMVGNVTPLTNIWKLKKFRKPFDFAKARELLGFNQTEMANAMGIHRNKWGKWERSEDNISTSALRLIKIMLKLHERGILKEILASLD